MRGLVRTVAVVLIATTTLTFTAPAATAWTAPRGPCTGYRTGAKDVSPDRREAVARDRTRKLAYCLWAALDPAISWTELVWVVGHESGFLPWALNPGGCSGYGCGGVLQHHLRYWPGRADALPREWFPNTYPNVWWGNARANLVAGLRMMQTRAGVCGGWTLC